MANDKRKIVLIAHDIRSTHNVGSLLRTAEGMGVEHIYLTGYTPYPAAPADERLPHLAQKLSRQINKTALGSETTLAWSHLADAATCIGQLQAAGYTIAALEQTEASIRLPDYQPPDKLAVLLGREVEGIDPQLLSMCDVTLEIPMFGQKESYNVVQAAAMVLYHCRFAPFS